MRRIGGFTLIELMIVVSVLAVVTAFAIPSLLAARKSANAAKAIGQLKTTVTVSQQYQVRFGSYPSSVNDLVSAGYMPDLNGSANAAYIYSYASSGSTWSMNADPRIPGTTGDRYFFIDDSGVIRFSSNGPADASSTPID